MLSDLCDRDWVMVEPPLERDGESVIARYNGTPIKAGFLIDHIEDSDEMLHTKYRSGQYDVELKIDFDIARAQLRVDEADGYDG